MDEFSRIRAKTRRNRGRSPLSIACAVILTFPLASIPPALASGGGHDAPPAAEPPKAPEPPPPPPPPPPRPRLPPPVLKGPIAAAVPKPRLTWIADPTTGIALGGFDPVAYFLDGEARLGSREHEMEWGGTTWQFTNEGNLAAFAADPEVYAPRFGGRCAFAVANGRPTEGSPRHFLVWHDRLLLFADAVSRAAFLQDPNRLLTEADRRWPAVLADLPE